MVGRRCTLLVTLRIKSSPIPVGEQVTTRVYRTCREKMNPSGVVYGPCGVWSGIAVERKTEHESECKKDCRCRLVYGFGGGTVVVGSTH